MFIVHLLYGLACYTLGLAALLESRRKSALLLGRQLPWLGAFGFNHGLVQWIAMLRLLHLSPDTTELLTLVYTLLLPLSGLLLIRFGLGLIGESGLARRLLASPLAWPAPAALALIYGLVVFSGRLEAEAATHIWSRYMLLLPGGLLTAVGFLRQAGDIPLIQSDVVKRLMYGAGAAFFIHTLFISVVVPANSYGLAPWVNDERILQLSGSPVVLWRMLTATAVTIFVIRALSVFDVEREQQLESLAARRRAAEATLRESEERFRNVFEYAPIGIDIVAGDGSPLRANLALQKMLGYSEVELKRMKFVDYTHPDDVEKSLELVNVIRQGQHGRFQIDKRYYHKEGHIVHGKVTVSGVRDEEDNLRYFIAMVEDITEQKRTEAALHEARREAYQTQLQMESEARRVAERWVNSLVDIGHRIAKMESVDDVLVHIVRIARDLLLTDTVAIGLFDQAGDQIEIKCQATVTQARVPTQPVTIGNPRLLRMLHTGRSYRIPNGEGDHIDATWYCPTVARQVKTAAVVPLHFDDQVVGGLWAARFNNTPFTSDQLFGLENLADQIVIALQHATMASQLQSVATLEERSRIAREMHDGLAQILGYLGVQMQTIQAFVQQGNGDKVLREINKTRRNIKVAQADVRENILSLRTTLAGEAGLIPALREYIAEFGVQSGIEAVFINEADGAPRISPLAEVQLVRIVQEALTNVRKHAKARHVQVRLGPQDGGLSIGVSDNGVGFVSNGDARHFGLQTMQERAASVGGRLSVHSVPGQGTQVCLWLPLLGE